jgi:hypothetical protein
MPKRDFEKEEQAALQVLAAAGHKSFGDLRINEVANKIEKQIAWKKKGLPMLRKGTAFARRLGRARPVIHIESVPKAVGPHKKQRVKSNKVYSFDLTKGAFLDFKHKKHTQSDAAFEKKGKKKNRRWIANPTKWVTANGGRFPVK